MAVLPGVTRAASYFYTWPGMLLPLKGSALPLEQPRAKAAGSEPWGAPPMCQDPPHLDPHGTDPLPSIFCKSFTNTKKKQWWVLLKHPCAHTWGSGPISPSAWGWDVCGSWFPGSLTSWNPKGLGQKIQPPVGLLPTGPFAHTQQDWRGRVKPGLS